MMTKHLISQISKGSIAEGLGIIPGDFLLSINDNEIIDVFDYRYLTQDSELKICILTSLGEEKEFFVKKEEDEELGLQFEEGLMDEYRSCTNKCIFCFIDQMPKGMRETLYFKDDDSRLSFLQGNYVTLTNMSNHELEKIIKYHLSPINISFQTMNPKLRCMMLNNRFAGEALNKVDKLFEAGISMNGQIVLCKGVNDGKELEYSIRKLMDYIPLLESVSVVPVGLSKFREGLYPLEPFTDADAAEVLTMIHSFQQECMQKYGTHFIHASDEWYILAGQELPMEDNYDGYLQLENGVGMLRLMINEFEDALRNLPSKLKVENSTGMGTQGSATISMATGKLAYPYICQMAEALMEVVEGLQIHVYEIINEFFGEMITVSGLLTGQDIIRQLKDKPLGERLLLPENLLRSGEEVLLDDVTVTDLEKALQVKIDIVKSSGYDFVDTVLKG